MAAAAPARLHGEASPQHLESSGRHRSCELKESRGWLRRSCRPDPSGGGANSEEVAVTTGSQTGICGDTLEERAEQTSCDDEGHAPGSVLTLVLGGAAASAVVQRYRIRSVLYVPGIQHPFPCFLIWDLRSVRYSYIVGVDVIMVDAWEDQGQHRRAFLHAAMEGDLDLLTGMAAELGKGAGECDRGALHLAAANGRTDVCRFLVQDLGFPVDARSPCGDTPLLLAATFGHTSTAAYLLERGADLRAPDSTGETPLHWAAYNGDRGLAMLLLHRGADTGAATPRGTALQVAATRAHPDIIAILLRHGADPNKVANLYFTPLASSLVGGSLECMKLLIQAGADVNAGGFSGTTPLFSACSRRGTLPFVKCLLEAGADPNTLDELGRLPIEVAAAHAETEVVQVLLPVTRRHPMILDWSIHGIVRYVDSVAYTERVIQASCSRKDELKQLGYTAFKRKDYDEAILLYSRAMKFDWTDTDATLYSDRCVCWLRIGVGDQALADAQTCTRMQPNWAKSYYRQGMAFRLLQDHASASAALVKALKLDPENAGIKEALWAVSGRQKAS
ncbi:ankyrin-1-like [Lolium rigidum]|uniref:ankyrin-1-like n=1 Tax=Lolium rigidum TaxID=89674 RepID=UPI001F5D2185|nr:ankyrin-1-like [Lolium rigidum]